ncbi:DUF3047 domain-containing protein [Neoroseomonas rubea]|uniref:DUF3047 domain-containing protein n=1 Tax=Neoroseomonas rubea TaxID=2748666 RepID=UPI0018DFB647|nr:DUF3047 domain-containing protein [Roseomonas rubea]
MPRASAHRLVLLLAALLAGGAGAPHPADPQIGWQDGAWPGIRPARFERLANGGIAVHGRGEGSFVWRWERRPAECLFWRWRVDEGPPATRLDRRGGDDRALAITIGFAAWPGTVSAWQRTQHALAQSQAGGRPLPRSAITLVWGGTGEEPQGFDSPYMAGLGRVFVLRAATAPRGAWFEERVDLGALWRQSFGGPPPPVEKIAIATDVDDTRARIDARVEAIRFGPCPQRS